MKTIQKLEIFTGVATQAVLLSYLCFLIWYFGLRSEINGLVNDGIVFLALPWIFSLPVAFGACYHSTRQGVIAFLSLVVGGILVIAILVFYWFIFIIWGLMSWSGLLFSLLTLIPVILSAATICLAAFSSLKQEYSGTKAEPHRQ